LFKADSDFTTRAGMAQMCIKLNSAIDVVFFVSSVLKKNTTAREMNYRHTNDEDFITTLSTGRPKTHVLSQLKH